MFPADTSGAGSPRPPRSRRGPAVVIGLLLAALVLAGSAQAEHRELDLVSTGPDGGNLDVGAAFLDASTDGARVFFETDESLVSADTDTQPTSTSVRVGRRRWSRPAHGRQRRLRRVSSRASADGTRVFFETVESLVSADTDTFIDVYERAGGQTTLVSTGPNGGNGDFDANFRGASADGTRVFFETNGVAGERRHRHVGRTSMSVRAGRRRWCRPARTAATAPSTRSTWAPRLTGRGSSSRPRSRW